MRRAALLLALLLAAAPAAGAAILIAPMESPAATLAVELRIHPTDPFRPLAHGAAVTEVNLAEAFAREDLVYVAPTLRLTWTKVPGAEPQKGWKTAEIELTFLFRRWDPDFVAEVEPFYYPGVFERHFKELEIGTGSAARWARFLGSVQQVRHLLVELDRPTHPRIKRALRNAVAGYVGIARLQDERAWFLPPDILYELADIALADDPGERAKLQDELDGIGGYVWKDLNRIEVLTEGMDCDQIRAVVNYFEMSRAASARIYEAFTRGSPELLDQKRALLLASPACRAAGG